MTSFLTAYYEAEWSIYAGETEQAEQYLTASTNSPW